MGRTRLATATTAEKPGRYARECWSKPAQNVSDVAKKADGEPGEIHEISEHVEDLEKWIFVVSYTVCEVSKEAGDLLVDSGACLCVAPKDFAKDIVLTPMSDVPELFSATGKKLRVMESDLSRSSCERRTESCC